MQSRAVFLDLNGTLVMPIKVETPKQYAPIPGALEAVAILNRSGFLCPVVTMQSRIAKGLYSEADFRGWFDAFSHQAAAVGAFFAGLYLCPHRFHSGCHCGKPKPGLYDQAVSDLDIDRSQSYVVGDSIEDMKAAQRLNIPCGLVLTGRGSVTAETLSWPLDHIGSDLYTVAEWIAARPRRP